MIYQCIRRFEAAHIRGYGAEGTKPWHLANHYQGARTIGASDGQSHLFPLGPPRPVWCLVTCVASADLAICTDHRTVVVKNLALPAADRHPPVKRSLPRLMGSDRRGSESLSLSCGQIGLGQSGAARAFPRILSAPPVVSKLISCELQRVCCRPRNEPPRDLYC